MSMRLTVSKAHEVRLVLEVHSFYVLRKREEKRGKKRGEEERKVGRESEGEEDKEKGREEERKRIKESRQGESIE